MTTPTSAPRNAKRKSEPDQLERREVLAALRAFRRGEFSVRMRENLTGVDGQIAEAFNEIVVMADGIRAEATGVARDVGKEGNAMRRMRRVGSSGGWAAYVSSVNELIEDLTGHSNELVPKYDSVLIDIVSLEHGRGGT